ncbi:MAG: Crp/Fnr family transcriptional regulator [Balneolaceae bacterium]|nr:Crp/Fnr family transcriptional regulator [Balneolaceae bacterium]
MKLDLEQCISEQVAIKPAVKEEILSMFRESGLDAGEHFVEAGQYCRKMAFIRSGVLRIYNLAEGQEVTLWIGSDHSFITALSSFVFDRPSRWYIQALTDAELLVITRDDHFTLLDRHPGWMEFDNRILANSFAALEQRIFAHLYMKAEDRYQQLLQNQPELFNRVPLRHIASMLGITPETLSRLRSK